MVRRGLTLVEVLVAITVGMFLTSALFVGLSGIRTTIRRADQLASQTANIEMVGSLCATDRTSALIPTSNWSASKPTQNARGGSNGTSTTILPHYFSSPLTTSSGGDSIYESYLLTDCSFITAVTLVSGSEYTITLAVPVEFATPSYVAAFNPTTPTTVITGQVTAWTSAKVMRVNWASGTPTVGMCIGTYSVVYFPRVK